MLMTLNENLIDKKCHMKGYLMMEVIPNYTALKIFKNKEY